MVSYEEEVWKVLLQIFNISKGKTIKNISVKKYLISNGSKYKWEDGAYLHFVYNDITFNCSYINHYEDSNDYKQKNIIKLTVYEISKCSNIEKKDILDFLKSKSRILKIQKMLNEK